MRIYQRPLTADSDSYTRKAVEHLKGHADILDVYAKQLSYSKDVLLSSHQMNRLSSSRPFWKGVPIPEKIININMYNDERSNCALLSTRVVIRSPFDTDAVISFRNQVEP